MKPLQEYLDEVYPFELTPDPTQGGYIATIAKLPGCTAHGATEEEAVRRVRDARAEQLKAILAAQHAQQ